MKTEQILEKTLLKEKHKSELIDRSIEKKFEKSTVEKKEKDRRANNKSQINEPSQSFSRVIFIKFLMHKILFLLKG